MSTTVQMIFAARVDVLEQQLREADRTSMELRQSLSRETHRAEVLEELVMDVVADCREGAKGYEIEERIAKVMRKLEGKVE
jgi:hypothetical protein